MRMDIYKSKRLLLLHRDGQILMQARVALGRSPVGAKQCLGDGKTPEGVYRICLVKECGKYGKSLGLSYPNIEDAQAGFERGDIDGHTLAAITQAVNEGRRPPWGSPLGGEIYLHEGGTDSDWTQGCIALTTEDMAMLFEQRRQIDTIQIYP